MARCKWVRAAIAALLCLGITAGGPRVLAQMPQGDLGASKMPSKSYMAKSAIYLPIQVDERQRSSLREFLLYVKEGPSAPWLLKQKAPPSQTGFECRLSQDGEYWFSVVTIDQSGKATPADVASEPPSVIVVLDTCGPQVDLKPMAQCASCAEGICLKCEVQDANPNPFQTRFEYQTGDHTWRQLDAMPNQADCFCIPRQAVLTGMVKVTCCDRAMNTTVKEFNLDTMGVNTAAGSAAPAAAKTVQQVKYEQPAVATQPSRSAEASNNTEEPSVMAAPATSKPKSLAMHGGDQTASADLPAAQAAPGSCDLNNCPRHNDAKWLIVNQAKVSLDYKIEDEGKSGIGKVEVWITENAGKTWEVLCDDPDKKSPVVFNLPHEGVFGVCMVVTNGRGFGGVPPKAGDAPDYMVELDTTKPQVELRSVKLGPPDDNARLDIVWQAEDKNLGSTPVDLYYSMSQQGPWTPIAKGVANSGKYRWYLPQEICQQAFVRLVVTDMAGNSTRCETDEPVPLDDLSRPRAVINGISGGGN